MFRLTQSVQHVTSMIRQLSTTSANRSSAQNLGSNLHKVNNLEKRFLVWTGKFKSISEVPDRVAGEVVEKARNRMRIRVANIMMVLTLVACLGMAISGKRAHKRGESVQKENLAWHESHKEANK